MVVRVVEIIETELFVKVDHFYRDAHHEMAKQILISINFLSSAIFSSFEIFGNEFL